MTTKKAKTIVVEDGVPIPPRGNTTEETITLRNLKVGQSFLYPLSKRKNLSMRFKNESPKKFITVTVEKGKSRNKGTIRVWRTK